MGPKKCFKIKNDIFVFNLKYTQKCLMFIFLLKIIVLIEKMNV